MMPGAVPSRSTTPVPPLKEWLRLPPGEERWLSAGMWQGFEVTEQLADRVQHAATASPIARHAQSTVVVAVQHGLIQTPEIFRHLINCGIPGNQIFWSDKYYSSPSGSGGQSGKTFPWLMDQTRRKLGVNCCQFECAPPGWFTDVFPAHLKTNLWPRVLSFIKNCRHKISQVLILDDGGDALTTVPPELLQGGVRVCGVEQTQHGLNKLAGKNLGFPVVEVASSAIKKQIESHIIIETVISKLLRFPAVAELLRDPQTIVGLIGHGALGARLLPELVKAQGVKCVLVHDPAWTNQPKPRGDSDTRVEFKSDLRELAQASLIIGTTGHDVFRNNPSVLLRSAHTDKTFVSCSSGDIEFSSLLKEFSKPQGEGYGIDLRNHQLTAHGKFGSAHFVYRGFPVNFAQRRCESADNQEIIITAAALLMGSLQALEMASGKRREGNFALLPSLQRLIYDTWIATLPNMRQRLLELGLSARLLEYASNEHYLEALSGG